ncbi:MULTISPECIES: isoprenylcysteine carboxylmethyltransferase family protein [Rhizobium]|nr:MULTISPECIES: isoprenylcysteine carboxylmethyltransferase family protein [Rhizobium]
MIVSKGPYRFLHYPNYVVVMGEIAALPLGFATLCTSVFHRQCSHCDQRVKNAALAGLSHAGQA